MIRFILPLVLAATVAKAQTPPPPPPQIVCEYDVKVDAIVCRVVDPAKK